MDPVKTKQIRDSGPAVLQNGDISALLTCGNTGVSRWVWSSCGLQAGSNGRETSMLSRQGKSKKTAKPDVSARSCRSRDFNLTRLFVHQLPLTERAHRCFHLRTACYVEREPFQQGLDPQRKTRAKATDSEMREEASSIPPTRDLLDSLVP